MNLGMSEVEPKIKKKKSFQPFIYSFNKYLRTMYLCQVLGTYETGEISK